MLKYENIQPALLTTMPVANQIPKFASVPKPRAAFTNFHLTTLTILIIRCSMNFSLISLPASPRIFSPILSKTIRVMTSHHFGHITPEELEVSKATITLYTKHFRKELKATKCRIQHQREKWHCGHNDHSSIDHTFAGITSDLIISPEHCRTLAKGASINLQGRWIGAEWDTKTPVVKVSGDPTGSNRNHCKTRGWISRDTFIIHMQKTTLKVTMENGKVLSDMGLILTCALEELGCKTTSLDPYAYIWDYPDNCVLAILRTEDVHIVKQDRK